MRGLFARPRLETSSRRSSRVSQSYRALCCILMVLMTSCRHNTYPNAAFGIHATKF